MCLREFARPSATRYRLSTGLIGSARRDSTPRSSVHGLGRFRVLSLLRWSSGTRGGSDEVPIEFRKESSLDGISAKTRP